MAWVLGIGFFLILLFAFPKQTGLLIAVLVALGLAVWVYFYSVQKDAEWDRSQIAAQVRVGGLCADKDYPILIAFKNGTRKTVEYISFELQAKRPMRSSAVYSDFLLSSDRVMTAGETYSGCWRIDQSSIRMPKQEFDPVQLDWSVKISSVRFQEE